MKKGTMEIICCPLCKHKLNPESGNNDKTVIAKLTCDKCHRDFFFDNAIPNLYISDKEIIRFSDDSDFLEFIVTLENVKKRIENTKIGLKGLDFLKINIIRFIMPFAWILLIVGILILILYYFGFNNISLPSIFTLIAMSLIFFIIDYLRYRKISETKYMTDLHILRELLKKNKLSEYEIRSSIKDEENGFEKLFQADREHASCKSTLINSTLAKLEVGKHSLRGGASLNVGCGGEKNASAAAVSVHNGYEMIGVDIHLEYLRQFNQIFNADVVQANAMALPFVDDQFDLIHFTDILEHLHNAMLGLKEVQRVQKEGGIIILSTPNRSWSIKCINPLIFAERLVSLYFNAILPPRAIVSQWMDFNYYHTEFSKKEIIKLMRTAGFEILSIQTYFPSPKYHIPTIIFQNLPCLKYMGTEFLIIAQKRKLK